MYIRVKREKSTYFVQCDPWSTILQVKQYLQNITDYLVRNQRLILLDSHHILDDAKTLSQQEVILCLA